MKKITFLFLLTIWSAGLLFSQKVLLIGTEASQYAKHAKEVWLDQNFKIPSYLEFNPTSSISIENWEGYLREELGMNQGFDFLLLREERDKLGMVHYRFQQTFNGTPIELAHYIVHTKNGKVHSMNGLAYNEPLKNENGGLSESELLKYGLSDFNANEYKWESSFEEALLKRELGNENASYYPKGTLVYFGRGGYTNPDQQVLCMKFNIYANEPLARKEYYLSVESGEIIYVHDLIHTGNVVGSAVTAYSGTRAIITDSLGDITFRLKETVRGLGIHTLNMHKSTSHGQAVEFLDSNNIWQNVNNNQDQYATDAHWGAEMTYDYYMNHHNRNSINDSGFALNSYVHYGVNYVNAFWDGTRMTYGDGDQTTNPLTSLDIAGHEITHGLTSKTARLIYANESGALNESFSDIFGACVENFARPSNWNWYLGEDIGSAFRNMANPNQFSDPDTYDGLNWIDQNCIPTSANDRCGVHTNSGVQNFWFHVLTVGKTGVNDLGDTFNVVGLGIDTAAQIAFRNLTIYLTPSSNYADARFYGIKSAIDLFGGCSPEVESTTNAWYAVGVGPEYTTGVSAQFAAQFDTLYCSLPALVQFTSNSNNVKDFHWEFGDGDTSNLPKPAHIYNTWGTYTISLYVDGGPCGKDSIFRNSYITIDSNSVCSYAFERNMSKVLTECQGKLYDNGGRNGDYEIRSRDTITIRPSGNDQIVIRFDSTVIESGYGNNCNHDYLEVFDGELGDGRSLGRFCSANLPPDSIISSGSSLSLVFYSDDIQARYGMIAEWYCINSTLAPVANFYTTTDTSCTGYTKFFDLSTNGVNSWLWNFGDGTTSTLQNPVHYYEQNGAYTVSLQASNSIGTNALSVPQSVFINRPISPALAGDTACINGRVKLAATGTGKLEWFTQPVNGNLAYVGDTLRINGITNDTSFYVSSKIEFPRVSNIPFLISGTGYYSDTTAEMYFDVFEPTLIESAIFNSNRTGIREVLLKNNLGEIIDVRYIQVSNVATQVNLNFEIYPGSNYSLSIGNRNPSCYVNTSGASYPYNYSNLFSVTGSSMGASGFPFFYFLKARGLACISPRARVDAHVDTSCIITSLAQVELQSNKLEVYPNPLNEQLNLRFNSESGDPIELSISNLRGQILLREQIPGHTELLQMDVSDLSTGVYFVHLRQSKSLIHSKFIISR